MIHCAFGGIIGWFIISAIEREDFIDLAVGILGIIIYIATIILGV